MASMAQSSGDLFIVSTSLAKPDATTRRFIRSHVMRGKNAGKFRTDRIRSGPQAGLKRKGAVAQATYTPGAWQEADDAEATAVNGWKVVTPHRIASELSLLGYGGEMQPYVIKLIHRALTVVKPEMFAMQHITTATADDDKMFCFPDLAQHPGILHSTLFAAQAFFDLATGQTYGPVARHHLSKALVHLQASLDDEKEAVGFATMGSIASLAMSAVVAGDFETAVKHMDGLKKIIDLRGGMESFRSDSMIGHKARVIDIGLAMGLGHDLRFTREDELSWSPQIALGPGRSARQFPELDAAVPPHMRPDPRLLNVWADLREFSRLVNEAAAGRTKIPIEVMFRLRTSVPHRLLRLRLEGGLGCHPGSGVPGEGGGEVPRDAVFVHELLRLSMMAFAKMLLIKLHRIGRSMVVLVQGLTDVLTTWQVDLERSQAAHGRFWRALVERSGDQGVVGARVADVG
ncbi:predicted protein [Chaetomium globosum CBS 148.51]|uniref:Uncharacterized protein n=1 Tax=Chaetomium globosum (strain ATCC 6205 / CBS 148.51 / DSM 1962 / NBRC 6347 / NRRL 1970) TaxID=306901 RepID=Q2HIC9_CHAGB|nr:uncharacterized protein CHGG_00025 [Chaetomium globosum CBS 148.51]EAQ91790.1 predicted protein [Chaetomium globosum CBS 148.51]